MDVCEDDLKAMEKGYCCKVSRFPPIGNSLYIRPNKIYQIGNTKEAAIQVGDSPTSICTLTCDKEANVVIGIAPQNTETIKINDIIITKKQLLNHLDVISIGNGKLQFLSFFNNGRVKLNCKSLHNLLMRKFNEFEAELNQIEHKTASLREYRKGLRNIFVSIDKKDTLKIQQCREMFKEVLTIIMDDNPPAKLQIECMKAGVDLRSKFIPSQQLVDFDEEVDQGTTPISKPTQPKEFKIINGRDKSVMIDTSASILLNFDENEKDDFEEFRKHQLKPTDDNPKKRLNEK